jgi:protein PsiE
MNQPHASVDEDTSAKPVGLADTAEARLSAAEDAIAIGAFRLIERFLLIVVALMTLGAVAVELNRVYLNWTINLSDLLLMFLYTEVIGMIAVFYTGRGSPFVYPIFIAITALARLIVLQGKEMAPQNMLFEAAAIVLLAVSVVILMRAAKG